MVKRRRYKISRPQKASGRTPLPASSPFPDRIRFAIQPVLASDGRLPGAALPRPTESTFIHMYVLSEERGGFESEEEANAFFAQYMSPGKQPQFPPPTQPWHQAQEIAYKGWMEKSDRARQNAARKALQISPDAVDGYLLLAHYAATWQEAENLCLQALAAAERLMGPDYREEFEDAFWGVAITRPYMRARFALGYCLWQQGRLDEAIPHFQDLLRLNKNDNQGVRYVLVAIYLESNRDREARDLMSRYPNELLCYWTYNQALISFRQYGDKPRSRRMLERAMEKNPLVPPLLLEQQRPRQQQTDFVEPGDISEAMEYYALYGNVWKATAGAVDWLNQQLSQK